MLKSLKETGQISFGTLLYQVQRSVNRDESEEQAPQGEAPEEQDGQSSTVYGYTNVVEYPEYRNIGPTYHSSADSTCSNAETIYIEPPDTEPVYMEPPT